MGKSGGVPLLTVRGVAMGDFGRGLNRGGERGAVMLDV